MSVPPSRWPRDTASRGPASTHFLPTMPLVLDALVARFRGRKAAPAQEVWHDTQPQFELDEDTQPGGLDSLPPQAAVTAAPPAALLDPADPLTGQFNEAVSGLQVRELDNDELFQRLFGPRG